MRIAIVDDLSEEATSMEKLLCSFADEKNISPNISRFISGEEFLDALKKDSFDIIFMDIYMDGMTGVETAKAMRKKYSRCILIFLTTSLEHMQAAFSCHAFEYIQKPASYERVREVMTDVINILPNNSQYMEFTCNRHSVRLMYSDFAVAVSSDHYIDITDISGHVYKTRMKFSDFTAPLLNDSRFLQINKGILVNMDWVVSFENNMCIMRNNLRMPVKVRDRVQIEEHWLRYSFEQIRTGQKKGEI